MEVYLDITIGAGQTFQTKFRNYNLLLWPHFVLIENGPCRTTCLSSCPSAGKVVWVGYEGRRWLAAELSEAIEASLKS